MPTPRSRLAVIFLTVLIDLIGFGIVLPILPYYAQRFGAEGLGFGALVGVFSLMQFLSTAFLGRLSDRVGRRPVLLATMMINAAGYTLFAFAGSYVALFVSRVVSGFASGNISAAQAYIADSTGAADRSRGMGLIGAAFGLGFVVGPALGGVADHYIGHSAPGLVAAGLSLLNFFLAFRILPESLSPEHRVRRGLLGLGHIGAAFSRPAIRPLALLWGTLHFAFAGYTVALPLFASSTLGWREHDLAMFFTLVGLVAAVVQGYLFGKLARRWGDRALVVLGSFGMTIGIAVVPFLGSSAQLYLWTVLLAFSYSVMMPAVNGLVSLLAAPQEQGAILGAVQAVAGLGRFAGPEAIGGVYDWGSARAAFLAAAGVMLAGAALSLRIAPTPAPTAGQTPAGPPAGEESHIGVP